MSPFTIRGLAALSLALASATAVHAVENDYFVHFTATNMTPGWVTAGSSDATPLVVPAGACGMVFESVYDAYFILPYDLEGPAIPNGNVEILLGTCGGWGVSIDGIDMPSGWDGAAIKVVDARAYWVDGNHQKLIYKHSCAPNCSTINTLYGGHGWENVSELFFELKSALGGRRQIRSLNVLLAMSDKYLQQLSRDLTTAIIARRRFTAATLETSVRKQEDDAQAKLISAISQLRDCQTLQSRGDAKSAILACDTASSSVNLARAGTRAAELWLPVQ